MIQRLTDAEIGERLAGMTLEEIQAHARFSPEACNRIVETLFKAVVAARAGTERDAVWNEAVEACAKLLEPTTPPHDWNEYQRANARRAWRIRHQLLRSLPTEKIENRPDGLGGVE